MNAAYKRFVEDKEASKREQRRRKYIKIALVASALVAVAIIVVASGGNPDVNPQPSTPLYWTCGDLLPQADAPAAFLDTVDLDCENPQAYYLRYTLVGLAHTSIAGGVREGEDTHAVVLYDDPIVNQTYDWTQGENKIAGFFHGPIRTESVDDCIVASLEAMGLQATELVFVNLRKAATNHYLEVHPEVVQQIADAPSIDNVCEQ